MDDGSAASGSLPARIVTGIGACLLIVPGLVGLGFAADVLEELFSGRVDPSWWFAVLLLPVVVLAGLAIPASTFVRWAHRQPQPVGQVLGRLLVALAVEAGVLLSLFWFVGYRLF